MMRVAVMGAKGQAATALVEQAGPEFEILTLSRPAFSLEDRDSATADYPTAARRPANSRLDNEKLRLAYGVALPPWRVSLAACCARLIQ